MAKSAQQKFSEYIDECRETSNAINAVTNRTNELYEGYAYAAGFLGSVLADAIGELPKARREDFRRRLNKAAEKAEQEFLIKVMSKENV